MSDLVAEIKEMIEDEDQVYLVEDVEKLIAEIEKLRGDLEIMRLQRDAKYVSRCQCADKVRGAHYEGYMAGVGDSEDYDHNPVVMEEVAWAEYQETYDE